MIRILMLNSEAIITISEYLIYTPETLMLT